MNFDTILDIFWDFRYIVLLLFVVICGGKLLKKIIKTIKKAR